MKQMDKVWSPRRAALAVLLVASLCVTSACAAAPNATASASVQPQRASQPEKAKGTGETITVRGNHRENVDVFGGSMAYGWRDPQNISYLQRGFAQRSRETGTDYHYIRHAIPGYTAHLLNQRYPGDYQRCLRRDKPHVVVLSWGLENDMSSRHRDSIYTFSASMHQEIAQALAAHSAVLIVTPPVTEELATTDGRKVEKYIHAEFRVGKSFHNNNISEIDIYHEMQAYMRAHHQTYRRYYGNRWHPNRAGHVLAGKLFAADLAHKFGHAPIAYHRKPRSYPVKKSHALVNRV